MTAHLTNREHFAFAPMAEASMSCGGTHHGTVRELLGRLDELDTALYALDSMVGAMPDAGFNDKDPRWDWWHKVAAFRQSIRGLTQRVIGPATAAKEEFSE